MSTNTNPYASPPPVADPVIAASFPPVVENAVLATRSERFLGALVDVVILLPINLLLGGIAGFALAMMLGDSASVSFQVTIAILGLLLGGGVFLLVNGYLLATRGQTVGKVVMKTRILRDNGEALPLGEMILKRYVPLWVVSVVPYVGGLFGLANALAIFRENHKCIHDDIAGTKVIKLS